MQIIYTIFFHPLAKYPGPLLGKITVLYAAYHSWKGDIHIDIWRCHERYGIVMPQSPVMTIVNERSGKYVRYRPNAIVFNTAAALHDIYRRPGIFAKSKGYSCMVHRAPNTFTILGGRDHARRRRILAQGLSEKALRDYEPRILEHISKFCKVLGADASQVAWSQPKDMSCWCNYLSFDIMSDVVFGAKYDLLCSETYRYICEAIEVSNVRMSFLVHAGRWAASFIEKSTFRRAIRARNRFVAFVARVVGDRLKRQSLNVAGKMPIKPDIFSHLQNAKDPQTGDGFNQEEVGAEGTTLIVAGSDTTSTSICTVLFYLAHNPVIHARVTAEVRSSFERHSDICIGPRLASCTYLRACIDEAHRMSPAVGNSLFREVLEDGAVIDGHFIPAGCDVGVGIYSIHHSEDYFRDPFVYRPERWLLSETGITPEEVERGNSVLNPFSLGLRGCLGKALATAELQLSVASIVHMYDFRLPVDKHGRVGEGHPSGEYGRHRSHEYQLYDHITSQKQGPFLQFRVRD